MKPSSGPKKINATKARNAMLLNLLATPGLGSLTAGRWVEGVGQLLLSVFGFLLVLVWFIRVIVPYYGQMFSDTPPSPVDFQTLKWGSGFFALAWVWSLVTSISLSQAASAVAVESMKNFAAGLMKLPAADVVAALDAVSQWQCRGEVISRTFQFKDFPAAIKFVNAVGGLAEQVQHHPDIDIRWNKVTLALTTHDAGGLTQKDFALARECDALAQC